MERASVNKEVIEKAIFHLTKKLIDLKSDYKHKFEDMLKMNEVYHDDILKDEIEEIGQIILELKNDFTNNTLHPKFQDKKMELVEKTIKTTAYAMRDVATIHMSSLIETVINKLRNEGVTDGE
jgi:non-homologous end joining protein Ku